MRPQVPNYIILMMGQRPTPKQLLIVDPDPRYYKILGPELVRVGHTLIGGGLQTNMTDALRIVAKYDQSKPLVTVLENYFPRTKDGYPDQNGPELAGLILKTHPEAGIFAYAES